MGWKHLTSEDRFYIHKRIEAGDSKYKIAKALGVHHTTINREVVRNTDVAFKGIYNYKVADKLAKLRLSLSNSTKSSTLIATDVETYILKRVDVHTSPKVISGELKLNYNLTVSKNKIYSYINKDKRTGGKLYFDLPHSGKPYKVKSDASKVKIKDRIGIEHRPTIANLKIGPGHYEIDTIYGLNQKSFLLTLTDKATKSSIIRKLPNKNAETIVKAFKDITATTFYEFKTITSDNGLEFAYHKQISEVTGASFYFANPYSSWERGLNEHTNGLIRRFFPKGTDFNNKTDTEVSNVEFILNSRGRESLGFKTPNQVMLKYLTSS